MNWRKKQIKDEPGAIGDQLSFAAAEAYKLLRTNLMFCLPNEQKCRIIGITSAIRSEGKSTTSINLAYTLAETEKNVLLIGMDMRLPTIAKWLGIVQKPGLSNLLAGLSTEAEVVQHSAEKSNLHIITAGDIPPNPSELLSSKQMEAAVAALAEKYDFIIFDLPPVNAVSDALIASRLTDGMIMVVRRGYNDQPSLAEAMRQLKLSEAKILGFVMTQGESQEKKYRKYGYRNGKEYYYRSQDRCPEKI